jgi:hypothetical protein
MIAQNWGGGRGDKRQQRGGEKFGDLRRRAGGQAGDFQSEMGNFESNNISSVKFVIY